MTMEGAVKEVEPTRRKGRHVGGPTGTEHSGRPLQEVAFNLDPDKGPGGEGTWEVQGTGKKGTVGKSEDGRGQAAQVAEASSGHGTEPRLYFLELNGILISASCPAGHTGAGGCDARCSSSP